MVRIADEIYQETNKAINRLGHTVIDGVAHPLGGEMFHAEAIQRMFDPPGQAATSISTAATGPNGHYPPPATPDTFGKATDPRRNRINLLADRRVRDAEALAKRAFWTTTGRLSPKNGRLRPVCRYIGP